MYMREKMAPLKTLSQVKGISSLWSVVITLPHRSGATYRYCSSFRQQLASSLIGLMRFRIMQQKCKLGFEVRFYHLPSNTLNNLGTFYTLALLYLSLLPCFPWAVSSFAIFYLVATPTCLPNRNTAGESILY